jgi:hypothetical protein
VDQHASTPAHRVWTSSPDHEGASCQALLRRRRPVVGPRYASEQRVRRVRNIEPDWMGCRIATAGGYYRSIYSTIRKDATTCSSTITRQFRRGLASTVEQNPDFFVALFGQNSMVRGSGLFSEPRCSGMNLSSIRNGDGIQGPGTNFQIPASAARIHRRTPGHCDCGRAPEGAGRLPGSIGNCRDRKLGSCELIGWDAVRN